MTTPNPHLKGMTVEFIEIKAEDFTSFTPGKVAVYIQIEQVLNNLGGSGKPGMEYKKIVMKAAGWKYDGLTGYAKNPPMAADAFNRVRLALQDTQDKDELLEKLKTLPVETA